MERKKLLSRSSNPVVNLTIDVLITSIFVFELRTRTFEINNTFARLGYVFIHIVQIEVTFYPIEAVGCCGVKFKLCNSALYKN